MNTKQLIQDLLAVKDKSQTDPSEAEEDLDYIIAELKLATNDSKPECEWELIDDCYTTSCGEDYCLEGGSTPDENSYHYCPKCGGKLRLVWFITVMINDDDTIEAILFRLEDKNERL